MKKYIIASIVGLFAGLVFAANYEADTFGTKDQSNSGRIIVEYFSYATSDTVHTNDLVVLARIPENARIIDGAVSVSAMGGAQTFDVGLMGADGSGYYTGTTANDPDFFLDGIACSNAVNDTFANQVNGDTNASYELGSRPVYVTVSAPAAGAAWTTNETITGWVKYIQP